MSSGQVFSRGVWACKVLSLALCLPPCFGQQEAPQARPAVADLAGLRKEIDTGHAADALARIAALRKGGAGISLSKLEGLAHYALGDLMAADIAFAAAVASNPADVESAQMRGLTLFRLGRPAEAIPLLESSASQSGQSKADPHYVLALCYIDTRRYEDARHAFAAQFGFPPDGAAAYLAAARMLLRREFLPVSQDFAQKALQLEPALPLAHELLGEIALAQGHTEEAIAELQKEKARNPLEGIVYERLGDASSRAARYDEAQGFLQTAVLLEPNATGPYILLGKTMLKKGDMVAASTYLERANQLDPANYMTHSLLAQAYRAMGRTEDAGRESASADKLRAGLEPRLEVPR